MLIKLSIINNSNIYYDNQFLDYRWVESLRLGMWSGGTWLLEFLGFLLSRYVSHHQEQWYDYLWYIPAAVNSLRGFGIFVILVITPENKTRVKRAMKTLRGTTTFLSKYSGTSGPSSTSTAHQNSTHNKTNRRTTNANRNNSISSQMTNLSSSCRQSVRSDLRMTIHPHYIHPLNKEEKTSAMNGDFIAHYGTLPKLIQKENQPSRRHSLGFETNNKPHSQLAETKSLMERRHSFGSVCSTDSESTEIESEFVIKRKPSLAAPVNLPCVNEEDCYEDVNNKLKQLQDHDENH